MAARTDKVTTRRLIIHCGVQKTASTSFHHFVGRNREALAGHVEIITPERGSLTRDLGRSATRFSLDPSPQRADRLAGCARALGDILTTGHGPVIVSHENLPGAMIGNGGVVTLYPKLTEIIGILERGLAPLVPEYVFYTRDMAAWKGSVHNQAVRSDHYPHTQAEFLSETNACGNWDDLQARMNDLVGAARVRFFRIEDESDRERPGSQLLRFAGVPEPVIAGLDPMTKRSNQSLNSGALEFLRLINGLDLARPARNRVARLVASRQSLFATG